MAVKKYTPTIEQNSGSVFFYTFIKTTFVSAAFYSSFNL